MLEVDHFQNNMAAGYSMRPFIGDIPENFASYSALPGFPEKRVWPQTSSPINVHQTSPSGKSEEDDDEHDFRSFTPPPPRERLSYTRYQLELLNNIFSRVKYPNSTQKQLIAKRVGITREQVKIWFQNRRRKDVVSKKSQSKEQDLDGNKSDQCDSKSDNGDSDSGVSTGDISGDAPQEDSESPMVPDVVMKSVIAELKRFENDPLKCKKLRKKMKAARKKEKKMSCQMKSLVIGAAYDMISPPNQVVTTTSSSTCTGMNKFNHSKEGSAFGIPKEANPRVQNFMENAHKSAMGMFLPNHAPNIRPTNVIHPAMRETPAQKTPSAPTLCDLPVLSDLLSNTKSTLPQTQRGVNTSESPVLNSGYPSGREVNYESSFHPHHHHHHQTFPGSPLSLGRVYPFPFIAEAPVALSAMRHYEPCIPHHPFHAQDRHLFQPFNVSSFQNPYFSPPSASLIWPSHGHSSSDHHEGYLQM